MLWVISVAARQALVIATNMWLHCFVILDFGELELEGIPEN